MCGYTAYGLGIASDIELPELLGAPAEDGSDSATPAGPEVVICRGRVNAGGIGKFRASPLAWAEPTDACLCYDGLAAYRITAGRQILVDPAGGADERVVRLFLLGPALALLLHQRGLLVLHASGVAIGGRAAAFVGEKGAGKSTLAAVLHARGHPLIADDVVPIDLRDRRALVPPGYPQLKLSPEAAAQIGDEPGDLPRVHPDFEKRARPAGENFPRSPLPLGRIFVLETADCDRVEPLSPQQRFIELVRHSYLAPLLESTGELAAHFRQVVALAGCVAVLRLHRRRELGSLPGVAELVERQMAIES